MLSASIFSPKSTAVGYDSIASGVVMKTWLYTYNTRDFLIRLKYAARSVSLRFQGQGFCRTNGAEQDSHNGHRVHDVMGVSQILPLKNRSPPCPTLITIESISQ